MGSLGFPTPLLFHSFLRVLCPASSLTWNTSLKILESHGLSTLSLSRCLLLHNISLVNSRLDPGLQQSIWQISERKTRFRNVPTWAVCDRPGCPQFFSSCSFGSCCYLFLAASLLTLGLGRSWCLYCYLLLYSKPLQLLGLTPLLLFSCNCMCHDFVTVQFLF